MHILETSVFPCFGPSGWLNKPGSCLFPTSYLLLLSAFQDLDSHNRELWKPSSACSPRSLSHVMDTDVFQSAMLFLSSAMSRYLIASQPPWQLVPADKSSTGQREGNSSFLVCPLPCFIPEVYFYLGVEAGRPVVHMWLYVTVPLWIQAAWLPSLNLPCNPHCFFFLQWHFYLETAVSFLGNNFQRSYNFSVVHPKCAHLLKKPKCFFETLIFLCSHRNTAHQLVQHMCIPFLVLELNATPFSVWGWIKDGPSLNESIFFLSRDLLLSKLILEERQKCQKERCELKQFVCLPSGSPLHQSPVELCGQIVRCVSWVWGNEVYNDCKAISF